MDCVKLYVDYQNSLKDNFLGFFIKKSGIFVAVAINLICGGIFVWIDKTKTILTGSIVLSSTKFILIIFVCITLVIIAILLFYQLNIKLSRLPWLLHQFAHYLRERHSKTEELLKGKNKNLSKLQIEDYFRNYCNNLCDKAKDYFRELINDDTIECAIRIVDKEKNNIDPSDPNVAYGTAGRSNGFNPGRSETSESIPANKGVPCLFFKKDCLGVLAYYDLKKAAEKELFIKTRSEERYPDEVKTFMVAPINGWDGKRKNMIGLFYVTSKRNPFKKKYTESIKLFADILGEAIPKIVDLYYYKRLKNS